MKTVMIASKDVFLYKNVLGATQNGYLRLFRIGNTDDFLFCYASQYSQEDALAACYTEMADRALYDDDFDLQQPLIAVMPDSPLLQDLLAELA